MTYDLKLRIWRGDSSGGDLVDYTVPVDEGEVVLDAVHHVQAQRVGRPGRALELQGRQVRVLLGGGQRPAPAHVPGPPVRPSRRASRSPSRPLRTFPVIRDLVTDVSFNYVKAAQVPAFTPSAEQPQAPFRMAAGRRGALAGVPQVHRVLPVPEHLPRDPRPRRQQAGLLRPPLLHPLRRARHAPQRRRGPQGAWSRTSGGLGLCNITKCCTEVCPENIKITDNAIIPMKERVVDVKYDPLCRFLQPAAGSRRTGRRASDGPRPWRASMLRSRHKDLWCSLECTPACQAGGRGFKSRQVRGRIAQLVERAAENREVAGSTPAPTTRKMALTRGFPPGPVARLSSICGRPRCGFASSSSSTSCAASGAASSTHRSRSRSRLAGRPAGRLVAPQHPPADPDGCDPLSPRRLLGRWPTPSLVETSSRNTRTLVREAPTGNPSPRWEVVPHCPGRSLALERPRGAS